jgi:WD40 repeat protein
MGKEVLSLSGAHGRIWSEKPQVDSAGHVFTWKNISGKQYEGFAVSQVAFTCQGSTIVAGCCPAAGRGTAPVWALHLLENRFSRVGTLSSSCSSVCTHPSRNDVAAVGTSSGMVHILQLGPKLAQTDLLRAHRWGIRMLQYSEDGAFIISSSDDAVVVWDATVCYTICYSSGGVAAACLSLFDAAILCCMLKKFLLKHAFIHDCGAIKALIIR